jgi:hypothetical protein
VSLHGRACCCVACTLTTVNVSVRSSVPYTMTCGTDKRYPNGTGTFNLNQPAGSVIATRLLNPTHPGICSYKYLWITTDLDALNGPTAYNRCRPPVGTNVWGYYARATIGVSRNLNAVGDIWTCTLALRHRWQTFGIFDNPGFFEVTCTLRADVPSPGCPIDDYLSIPDAFLDCASVTRVTGLGPTLPAGAAGPLITWGTPSGSSSVT